MNMVWEWHGNGIEWHGLEWDGMETVWKLYGNRMGMLFHDMEGFASRSTMPQQREPKAKYLFFGLMESSHNKVFSFCIAFGSTGRKPARRRVAGGRPAVVLGSDVSTQKRCKRYKPWCGCSPSIRHINILLLGDAARPMPITSSSSNGTTRRRME